MDIGSSTQSQMPDPLQGMQQSQGIAKSGADPALLALLSDSVSQAPGMQVITKTYSADTSAPELSGSDSNTAAASEQDVQKLRQAIGQKTQAVRQSLLQGMPPKLQALVGQPSSDPHIQQLQGALSTASNLSALASMGLQSVSSMQPPNMSGLTNIPAPGPITSSDPAAMQAQQLSNMISTAGNTTQIASAQAQAMPGETGQMLQSFLGPLSGAMSELQSTLGGLGSGAQNAASGAMSSISNAAGGLTGGIQNAASGAMGSISNVAGGLTGGIQNAASGAMSSLSGVAGGLKNGLGGLLGPITSGLGGLGGLGGITSALSSIPVVGSLFSGAGGAGGIMGPLQGLMGATTSPFGDIAKSITSPFSSLPVVGPLFQQMGNNPNLALTTGSAALGSAGLSTAIFPEGTQMGGSLLGVVSGGSSTIANQSSASGGASDPGEGLGSLFSGLTGMFSGITNMIPGMGASGGSPEGGGGGGGLEDMLGGLLSGGTHGGTSTSANNGSSGDALGGLIGTNSNSDGLMGTLGLGAIDNLNLPIIGPAIQQLAAPFESLPLIGPTIGWMANHQVMSLGAMALGCAAGGPLVGIATSFVVMSAAGRPIPIVSDLVTPDAELGGSKPTTAQASGSSVPAAQAMGNITSNLATNPLDPESSADSSQMIGTLQQTLTLLEQAQTANGADTAPSGTLLTLGEQLQAEGFGAGQPAGDSLNAAVAAGQAGDNQGMVDNLNAAMSQMGISPTGYAATTDAAAQGVSSSLTSSSNGLENMLSGMFAA